MFVKFPTKEELLERFINSPGWVTPAVKLVLDDVIRNQLDLLKKQNDDMLVQRIHCDFGNVMKEYTFQGGAMGLQHRVRWVIEKRYKDILIYFEELNVQNKRVKYNEKATEICTEFFESINSELLKKLMYYANKTNEFEFLKFVNTSRYTIDLDEVRITTMSQFEQPELYNWEITELDKRKRNLYIQANQITEKMKKTEAQMKVIYHFLKHHEDVKTTKSTTVASWEYFKQSYEKNHFVRFRFQQILVEIKFVEKRDIELVIEFEVDKKLFHDFEKIKIRDSYVFFENPLNFLQQFLEENELYFMLNRQTKKRLH